MFSKEMMNLNTLDPRAGTVSLLAALLNDPARSRIDDPNTGTLTVSFLATDQREADKLARMLRSLELLPRFGETPGETAAVSVYTGSDQLRLYRAVEAELEPDRRRLFDQLLQARGSIPLHLLDRIERLDALEYTPDEIADQLNETSDSGQWTAERVRTALA